jgi:hypothetical protein
VSFQSGIHKRFTMSDLERQKVLTFAHVLQHRFRAASSNLRSIPHVHAITFLTTDYVVRTLPRFDVDDISFDQPGI